MREIPEQFWGRDMEHQGPSFAVRITTFLSSLDNSRGRYFQNDQIGGNIGTLTPGSLQYHVCQAKRVFRSKSSAEGQKKRDTHGTFKRSLPDFAFVAVIC